jgi:hypothetical protein
MKIGVFSVLTIPVRAFFQIITYPLVLIVVAIGILPLESLSLKDSLLYIWDGVRSCDRLDTRF